jgi:hypothetical protein
VSPDGSRVVASKAELQIKNKSGNDDLPVLAASDSGEVLTSLVVDGRTATDLFFCSDGSRLFGRLEKVKNADGEDAGDGLAVWDAKSGNLIASIASIRNYSQSPPTVSRDGKRILVALKDDQAALYDIVGNGFSEVNIPDTGTFFISARTVWAMSADGRYLLAGRGDGVVVVTDIGNRTLRGVFDTNRASINLVAISEDGRYIATADDSNTLSIFDGEIGELVRSPTLPDEIASLAFTPGSERLAVLDQRNLTIFPVGSSLASRPDVVSTVDAARKLGFNLVSEEDRQRYKLGTATEPKRPTHNWAAINPNSEGTAPVVWAETEQEARDLAAAACRQSQSTTCASIAAVTEDLTSTFVYFCCTRPKLGCAAAAGAGDRALLSAKETLAKAKYSSCEVRAALSARDGKPR